MIINSLIINFTFKLLFQIIIIVYIFYYQH